MKFLVLFCLVALAKASRFHKRSCDVGSITECIQSDGFESNEELCSSLTCMIGKLEGCDDATIEAIAGPGGLSDLQTAQAGVCASNEDCDLAGLAQCGSGEEMTCEYATCMHEKLSGCSEDALEQMAGEGTENPLSTIETLKDVLCASEGNEGCDIAGVQECQSATTGTEEPDTDAICSAVGCVVDKISGCPQDVLDQIPELQGVTVEQMETIQESICSDTCDIASLASCNKPGQDKETACSNMQCVIDGLSGCSQDMLDMFEAESGLSLEYLQSLSQQAGC